MALEKTVKADGETLAEHTKSLEKVDTQFKEVFQKINAVITANNPEDATDAVFKEFSDRDDRKSNLIIYQLPKPSPSVSKEYQRMEADVATLRNILETIGCTADLSKDSADIKCMFRAGEFKEGSNKPRPFLIGFRNLELTNRILENARKLARTEFKDISIAPDLTPRQRKDEADMRKEAEMRNENLSEEDRSKNLSWVVVGRKGERKLRKMRSTQDRDQGGRVNQTRKRPRAASSTPPRRQSQRHQ